MNLMNKFGFMQDVSSPRTHKNETMRSKVPSSMPITNVVGQPVRKNVIKTTGGHYGK